MEIYLYKFYLNKSCDYLYKLYLLYKTVPLNCLTFTDLWSDTGNNLEFLNV